MSRSSRLIPLSIIALAAALALRGPWTSPASARQDDDDHSGDYTIAVCATLLITDQLMESDRFKPDRDELTQAKRDQLQPIIDQLQDIQRRGQAAQAAGEDIAPLQQEYQTIQNQLRQAQQQAEAELNELTRTQIVECYDLVRASAGAIAKDLGYDYVVSSSRSEDDLDDNPAGEFLSRPMLVYPEEVDITEEVRDDLKLE